jgi:hypothetical protein
MAPAGQVVTDFTIARINLVVGAHAIVQRLRGGQTLLLARDPNDQYDPDHAIMVIVPNPGSKRKVGYLPLGLAKELAPLMDAGVNIIARKAPNPLYGICQVAYIPPVKLSEGVTQQDLNEATEVPPLGDSRRPHKDDPNAEQGPTVDTADPPKGV